MTRESALTVAKPILFNTDMVRAIQDNLKTATRRIVKPQPANKNDIIYKHLGCGKWFISPDSDNEPEIEIKPRYKVGDILYVRETWSEDNHNWLYRADFSDTDLEKLKNIMRWAPSIHMPKKLARIFLLVTDVRMEHLQDMTEEEAFMEGFSGVPWCAHSVYENYPDSPIPCEAAAYPCCPSDPPCNHSILELFGFEIWDKTIKKSDLAKYGWEANPWVWVIEFEMLEVTQ